MLMTADDIAEMLRLNAAHVRDRLTKERGFPAGYRVGGALRWKREDIEDWLESCAVSPTARRAKKQTGGSRSSAKKGQSAQPSAPTPAG